MQDPKDTEIKTFADLPLSKPTHSGLESSHFKTLTDVQRKAIPLALKGLDCLGAAKTGSGKTLAFLVPVLENLYRKSWADFDGLGALIISPTRELAVQIFEVLRRIGRDHTFSAGLVIGGKSLKEEQERLNRMNIVVCTPGRILQHMDQTASFDADHLQMLVLDEADRIMDMGFQWAVDAIVEHLPATRQTLLFSATQTKKVSDLARLSLRDPEYVAVHEAASSATPLTLQQHYLIIPLPEKLNTLYSFIRSNLRSKILVFMSSGKQVRFVYESFRQLQPGMPLLHLLGKQKQTARLNITTKFASAKHSCLFATDVVARGLDFPAVDWVIQLDCPEDADTYIHRVGRTARYERNGRAVLFLEPTEEGSMLKRLEHKKVPIEKINVRQKKQQSIQSQLQNMCFKDPELKYLGQKAFISYTRSVHLQKDKEIFKLNELPLEEFSASLGLPGAPKITFVSGDDAKKIKNAPRVEVSDNDDEDGERKRETRKDTIKTRYDRMFERRNQDVLADHFTKIIGPGDHVAGLNGDADEDDNFLTVKRMLPADDDETILSTNGLPPNAKFIEGIGKGGLVVDSKRREKLLKSKKQVAKLKVKGTKMVFDDDGKAHPIYELEDEEQFKARGPATTQRVRFLEEETKRIQSADLKDKQLAKDRKRDRKEKRKAREAFEEDGQIQVELESPNGSDAEHSAVSSQLVKKAKKWFEDDPEKKSELARESGTIEPETLEDLETLASRLLA